MYRNADTVYDRSRPWETDMERQTDAVLRQADTPAAEIRQLRPPVPQMLFRPTIGYPTYEARQAGITQIIDVDRYYPALDFSGRVSGYQGSLRSGFPALNTF